MVQQYPSYGPSTFSIAGGAVGPNATFHLADAYSLLARHAEWICERFKQQLCLKNTPVWDEWCKDVVKTRADAAVKGSEWGDISSLLQKVSYWLYIQRGRSIAD